MSSNGIFNVPDVTGAEASMHETSAADALANAKSGPIAREIEKQADATTDVAHEAAEVAQSKGSAYTGDASALDTLQQQAKGVLNAGVSEGKHDVNGTQTGPGYVDQAKALAGQAITTAQSYLPTANGQPKEAPSGTNTGIPAQLQAGIETAKGYIATAADAAQPTLEKAKEYLQGTQQQATGASSTMPPNAAPSVAETAKGYASSAQQAAQPHIETAKGYVASAQQTAQPHIDKAKEYVQGVQAQGKTATPNVGNVAPSTAPLETGSHTGGPYPDA